MTVKLTAAEAADLFEFLDDATEAFELAPARGDKPAKVVQVRGASAAEYLKWVVRRNAAVQSVYVDGIRTGIAEAKAADAAKAAAAAADADENREIPIGTRRPKKVAPVDSPETPSIPAAAVDPITEAIVSAAQENIREGALEAKAMLIAVCIGRAGDEAFEAAVISHPRFGKLAALADFKTRGADPYAFSEAVSQLILGEMPTAPARDPEPDQATETAA